MKILYYFPNDGSVMSKWQLFHFVNELNRNGIVINTVNPLYFENEIKANEVIIEEIKNGQYDLFMTCCCNEVIIFKSTLLRLKEMGIPTLSFRPDNLVIPFNDSKLSPYFDLVWLTSFETKYLYDKWGAKSFFAPYAANPYVFYPRELSNNHHISFIGTPYGSRTGMINSLSEGGIALDVYCKSRQINSSGGDNLHKMMLTKRRMGMLLDRFCYPIGRRLFFGTLCNKIFGSASIILHDNLNLLDKVNVDEQPGVYSSSSLSLSSTSALHTDVLSKPVNIINLRNFEIPMSGGLQFCRYSDELAGYFEEDKEIVFYRNNDELVDKARFYTQKAPDSLISSMKAAARKRAESEHTWMHRFSKAFDILGLKY